MGQWMGQPGQLRKVLVPKARVVSGRDHPPADLAPTAVFGGTFGGYGRRSSGKYPFERRCQAEPTDERPACLARLVELAADRVGVRVELERHDPRAFAV